MLLTEKPTNAQEQDYATVQFITWLFREGGKKGGIISYVSYGIMKQQ